jgi:hypothetical protein
VSLRGSYIEMIDGAWEMEVRFDPRAGRAAHFGHEVRELHSGWRGGSCSSSTLDTDHAKKASLLLGVVSAISTEQEQYTVEQYDQFPRIKDRHFQSILDK